MLYFSRSLIQETPYLQTLIRSRGSVIICLTEMCWTCWSRVTRLEQKTCQLQSESVLYCSLFDHRRKVFLRLLRIFTLHFFLQALLRNILRHARFMENVIVKSNQIKSLLLHKCLGEWNSYERAPDSAKKFFFLTVYIWTVHIYRLYRRQCAKYTYIYSVHTVYYKDTLNYQLHIIHRMGTSTLCTLSVHYLVYT